MGVKSHVKRYVGGEQGREVEDAVMSSLSLGDSGSVESMGDQTCYDKLANISFRSLDTLRCPDK